MYAIRSLRTATPVSVGGNTYDHQAWTLTPDIDDDTRAQAQVVGTDKPLLEIIEVSGEKDPLLSPFPVGTKLSKSGKVVSGTAPDATPPAQVDTQGAPGTPATDPASNNAALAAADLLGSPAAPAPTAAKPS